MDRENRERLEQVLSYQEDTAGRLMNPDVVTVRADTTVDVVLRYLRLRGELPEHTDHLYVVSRRHQYLGRIALQVLLNREAHTPINQLIDDEQPDRKRAVSGKSVTVSVDLGGRRHITKKTE